MKQRAYNTLNLMNELGQYAYRLKSVYRSEAAYNRMHDLKPIWSREAEKNHLYYQMTGYLHCLTDKSNYHYEYDYADLLDFILSKANEILDIMY